MLKRNYVNFHLRTFADWTEKRKYTLWHCNSSAVKRVSWHQLWIYNCSQVLRNNDTVTLVFSFICKYVLENHVQTRKVVKCYRSLNKMICWLIFIILLISFEIVSVLRQNDENDEHVQKYVFTSASVCLTLKPHNVAEILSQRVYCWQMCWCNSYWSR